jgi:hypothetical protein
MAINIDAAAVEARYGQKTGQAAVPVPMQDLWAPGSGAPPPKNPPGSIPAGQPVPPGVVISQVVGRGQPAPGVPAPGMAVVPPQQQQSGQPAMAVVPPQATNRTSIGTFIEISPTVSNPMTATPPPINTGLAEAPVVQEAPKPVKRKKVDLVQEILTHIWELGGEKSEEAQKFYDRSPDALKRWQSQPGTIPLSAVMKFLNKRPGVVEMIAEDLEPHFAYNGDGGITSLPNRGKTDAMVLSPVLERPTLPWSNLMCYLAKKYEIGYSWQADTMIVRSRNVLAQRFLKSGATWSLWIDGDMAAPIANGDWYRWITGSEMIPDEFTRYDVWQRLKNHDKAVIGGVYASRRYHGQLVIQPEIHPRHHEDKLLCNDIRKGTARGLIAVDWIGFGCALVHREVFLEVQRRFPDLAPKTEFSPWGFFDTQGDMGEDEAFCQRLRACSIPVWLDTQLICGHLGNMAFMPEHTAPVMAM